MLHASCHCGAVQTEVSRKPQSLTECTCSICRRYGARWAYCTRKTTRISCSPADGTYTINGTTYQASDVGTLSGTVKVSDGVTPYVGFGYGNVAGAGVNFYFDVGVMFQGSPRATLTANCGVALSPSQCTQLQNDVASERLRVEDKLESYNLYPVASIGITIGF